MTDKTLAKWVAAGLAAVAVVVLALWLRPHNAPELKLRIPGTDAAPGAETAAANPVLSGKLTRGDGQPASLPGSWPQFRGPNRDGQFPSWEGSGVGSAAQTTIQRSTVFSRDWTTSPPRELWSLDVGEGYAGASVRDGRVYLLDYDRDAKQSALRCLSLADGKEIWRFAYPITIKRNHGMTRTTPAVTDKFVVALDSKCNVLCLDAASGELRWSISLVREFGATVPEWYAGQCPLVDGDKVILAPGGKDALLLAVDLVTGKPLWQTPNPRRWKMTHSSVMPMDFAGRRLFVYCASGGAVGVDANNGALLWETSDWKISIATVPSPLPLPDGKIFFTGGYNAGSLMLQLVPDDPDAETHPQPLPGGEQRRSRDGEFPSLEGSEVGSSAGPRSTASFSSRTVFRISPDVFGATQHTPIFKDNHLYGVRADGRFVCLGLDGKVVWASGSGEAFGLGSFLMAGDLIFALNDSGKLRLIEATPARFNLLAQAQVLQGRESWGPMALAGDRLIARDLTRLVCLGVGAK